MVRGWSQIGFHFDSAANLRIKGLECKRAASVPGRASPKAGNHRRNLELRLRRPTWLRGSVRLKYVTRLFTHLTYLRHRVTLRTMNLGQTLPGPRAVPKRHPSRCPFLHSPSSLAPRHSPTAARPGPISNLKFEVSNPLWPLSPLPPSREKLATRHSPQPLAFSLSHATPVIIGSSARCYRLAAFSPLPSSFSLSEDPSLFPKDPSRKPEYPPSSRNIPPYPRISPPPFFIQNHLHQRDIHEHNITPIKNTFVDYQPLAHSKIFHRISALGAFTSSSPSPHRPRCHLRNNPPPALANSDRPDQPIHSRPNSASLHTKPAPASPAVPPSIPLHSPFLKVAKCLAVEMRLRIEGKSSSTRRPPLPRLGSCQRAGNTITDRVLGESNARAPSMTGTKRQ